MRDLLTTQSKYQKDGITFFRRLKISLDNGTWIDGYVTDIRDQIITVRGLDFKIYIFLYIDKITYFYVEEGKQASTISEKEV